MRSDHQRRVDRFMDLAGHRRPDRPKIPSLEERQLAATLVFEEALELIEELGFLIQCPMTSSVVTKDFGFEETGEKIKISSTMKEAADLRVVTTRVFSIFGLNDETIQEAVDNNNLEKFGPGHSFRADGKLLPPPGFRKIDLGYLDQE